MIIWTFLTLLLGGCISTPNVSKVVLDQNLPAIESVRTLADMNQIGLEWTPSYDESIEGYYIYRSSQNDKNQKLKRVATIDDKYSSHYVDKKLTPDTTYNYSISSYAKSGKESVPSPIVSVTTNPQFDAVPFIESITGLPNRAKIIWRPHPFASVTSYIIERKKPTDEKWKKIATVQGRLNAEYIDKGLDENDIFIYRVIAKTSSGILSKPSQEVTSRTKPLPTQVEHIKATTNLPKKISLTWSLVEGDISYYKVYSSPTSMLLFTYLAKTKETNFDDIINSDGTTRYYKITAVDTDGLESLKSDDPIRGQTLSVPTTPQIFETRLDMGSIFITWRQTDARATSYHIIKKVNGVKSIIKDLQDTTYIDTHVQSQMTYEYNIIAIDKYGLASKPSETITIKVP